MPFSITPHLIMALDSDTWQHVGLYLSGFSVAFMVSSLFISFRKFLYHSAIRRMDERVRHLHIKLMQEKVHAQLLGYNTSSKHYSQYLSSLRRFDTIISSKQQQFHAICRFGLLCCYGASIGIIIFTVLGWERHFGIFMLLFLLPLSLPWIAIKCTMGLYERLYEHATHKYRDLTDMAREECKDDVSAALVQMKNFLQSCDHFADK